MKRITDASQTTLTAHEIFPVREHFVPSEGIFCSQYGNKNFETSFAEFESQMTKNVEKGKTKKWEGMCDD